MKKLFSIVLSFLLASTGPLVGSFAVSAAGNPFDEQRSYPQAVTEDFETETLPESVAVNGARISVDHANRGISSGALLVTPSSGSHSVYVLFGAKSGIQYQMSLLTKDINLSNIRVKIWSKMESGTYSSQEVIMNTKAAPDGWKKITGSFSGESGSVGIGYLEFFSVSTSAYFLDEILITPEFDSTVVKEGNLVQYSSFDTQEEINNLSYNKRAVTISVGEGAAGTKGSLHVVANGRTWANVSQDADLRVGRKYKVSFWAKANDETTEGLVIQLAIDRSRRTDPAAPLYAQPSDSQHPTIQSTWTKHEFIYQCTAATTDVGLPTIYFRVGNKATDVLDYCVDELVIEEVPNSYEVDVNTQFYGDSFENSAVILSVNGYLNSVGAWYRILAPYGNGFVIVKSGFLNNGETVKYYSPESVEGTYKAEYVAVDAWGLAGSAKEVYLSNSQFDEKEIIRANYDTSIWVDEMETLDATVTYQGGEASRNVLASIALYDDDGKLLSINNTQETVQAQRTSEIKLSIANDLLAEKSKVFLWDAQSFAPVRAAKEFTKTIYDEIIYVDPENGINSSKAPGTFHEPFKTMAHGRTKARSLMNDAIQSDSALNLCIVMMPGVYAGFDFTKVNTPCADNVSITYTSFKPGEAVVSEGKQVTEFTLYNSEKNIYQANISNLGTVALNSRQIYVNGVRAVRARSEGKLENCVNLGKGGVGVTTTDTSLLDYKKINELELVFYENWTNPRFVVETASFDEETQLVTLELNESLWNIRMNGGNTVPTVPEYYENAFELLDEGGEFYIDKTFGKLYYIPRDYEDMSTAEIVIPCDESLMSITGTAEEPMKNITFDGISFEHTTWTAPNASGFADGQNNGGSTATTSGFIPGAIELTNVHNVNFYNCKISKIGQTAVKMLEAVQNCDFVGNEIYDTSGGAIFVGDATWQHARAPKEEKYYQINNNVTDNYIHDISVEFRAGAAITAAFPKHMNICNNEVYSTAYSSVHTGWGWGSKAESGTVNLNINNNYLHKILNTIMFDGGAIYTLGHTGGSLDNLNEMCGNYCYDIGNMFGVLYPDEGSSYWLLDNNVVDQTQHPVWKGKGSSNVAARWTHIHINTINNIVYGDNNYSTTAEKLNNGTDIQYQDPHVYPNADWPEEAQKIIAQSGVREPYRDNFDFGLQEVYFPAEFKMEVGDTISLSYIPTTSKMVRYDISNVAKAFKSDNPDIVSVNANGELTAHSSGTTKIKVAFMDNEVERTFEGTVVVP